MMKGKNGILSNFSNTDIAIEPKAKHQGVKKQALNNCVSAPQYWERLTDESYAYLILIIWNKSIYMYCIINFEKNNKNFLKKEGNSNEILNEPVKIWMVKLVLHSSYL